MRKNRFLIFTYSTKRLYVFLALASFSAFFSCESYRTALEEQYFQRGQIAFEKKDYGEALEFFQKAQKVSFSTVARYRMAEIYLIQNKFEESRKLINTLLRIDRKNILTQELNILWYIKKNDRKKVTQLYKKLESEDIRMRGRTYANTAVFYLNDRKYKTALEFFRKADEAGEKSVEMLVAYLATLRLYTRPESEVSQSAELSEEDNSKPTAAHTEETQMAEDHASTEMPQRVVEQNITQTLSQTHGETSLQKTNQETQETKTPTAETENISSEEAENISAIDLREEIRVLREDIRIDMDRVVSTFIELYEKHEVSTAHLMQAAEDLERDKFFMHAFALYKAVAEQKNQEAKSEKKDSNTDSAVEDATRVKAYRALVHLITKKQYNISDENAPLTVLAYVKEIFKILFPRDENLITEYTKSLFDILKMEEMTDVLKAKLQELYDEYGIVMQDDEKSISEDETTIEGTSNPN